MVQALQEKVKAEQDSRMRRALEDLERNARLESERARQMFEAQQVCVDNLLEVTLFSLPNSLSRISSNIWLVISANLGKKKKLAVPNN